jgi:hypothetical protein
MAETGSRRDLRGKSDHQVEFVGGAWMRVEFLGGNLGDTNMKDLNWVADMTTIHMN